MYFLPNAEVVIDDRIATGDLANLPPETRTRLGGASSTLAAAPLSGVTHSAKDAATPTRITSTTPGSTKRRACCAAAVGALDGATSS
jgi:hypothetical protein